MRGMTVVLVAFGIILARPAVAAGSYLDQLKPSTEVLKLEGRKGSSLFRPGYAVGEYTGEAKATKSHSQGVGLFTSDKFNTNFSINAPSLGAGVTAECGGGPGKIALMELVAKEGSISAAGKTMGMSYRRAWLLIDEINRIFREPLVEKQMGGSGGGGAHLTALGHDVVSRYRAIEAAAAGASAADLRALKALLPARPSVAPRGEDA